MKKATIETIVGVFVLLGIICLGYLSVKLGKMEFFGGNNYEVHVMFDSVAGLKSGASVEIAGVEVGRVERIELDSHSGAQAKVTLRIGTGVKLTDDVIAAVRTRGLIGDKYVLLKPGGSEKLIAAGGKIREAESAVDFEELLSKYIHGQVD
jgi:phospholipid/cholesterol/gamma-HCH transport system substrate-binding protein